MNRLFYILLRGYIRMGIFLYFQKTRFVNINDMPWGKPMLLLPNHQNALLDALLIAAFAPKSPYFLTRADVFGNPLLNRLFHLLQMLPVYRIRDGRDTLSRNIDLFDKCGKLLAEGEAIVMFPEANHNLQRRVRPLSKGFTRIVFHTLETYPGTVLYLAPVGVNYRCAYGFPDSVAFYFGKAIDSSPYADMKETRNGTLALKEMVQDHLKGLTTHIPEGQGYDAVVEKLDSLGVDYLKPEEVNATLAADMPGVARKQKTILGRVALKLWDLVFLALNFFPVLPWKLALKPKVPEPEFISTYRFLYALFFYPVCYLLFYLLFRQSAGQEIALGLLAGHLFHNLLYVKLR